MSPAGVGLFKVGYKRVPKAGTRIRKPSALFFWGGGRKQVYTYIQVSMRQNIHLLTLGDFITLEKKHLVQFKASNKDIRAKFIIPVDLERSEALDFLEWCLLL